MCVTDTHTLFIFPFTDSLLLCSLMRLLQTGFGRSMWEQMGDRKNLVVEVSAAPLVQFRLFRPSCHVFVAVLYLADCQFVCL